MTSQNMSNTKKILIIFSCVAIILIIYIFYENGIKVYEPQEIKLIDLSGTFSENKTQRKDYLIKYYSERINHFEDEGDTIISFFSPYQLIAPQLWYAIHKYGISVIFLDAGLETLKKNSLREISEKIHESITRLRTPITNEITLSKYLDEITRDSIFNWKYYKDYNTIVIGGVDFEQRIQEKFPLKKYIEFEQIKFGRIKDFVKNNLDTKLININFINDVLFFKNSDEKIVLKKCNNLLDVLLNISGKTGSSISSISHDWFVPNQYLIFNNVSDNIRRYIKFGHWSTYIPNSIKKNGGFIYMVDYSSSLEQSTSIKKSKNLTNQISSIQYSICYTILKSYDYIKKSLHFFSFNKEHEKCILNMPVEKMYLNPPYKKKVEILNTKIPKYYKLKIKENCILQMTEIPESSFDISIYEISIGQYLEFCKESNSNYPEWYDEKSTIYNNNYTKLKKYYSNFSGSFENFLSLPVSGINFFDAKAFCDWLSKRSGENFRLPSSAEWSFAAKSNRNYIYSGSNNADSVAWYFQRNKDNKYSPETTGKLQPNGFGIYDMSGNVEEWCEVLLPDFEPIAVVRGGSYLDNPENCRIDIRKMLTGYEKKNKIGFRIVRDIKDKCR